MIYVKGIWRLPVLTREKAVALHHGTYIAGLTVENSCVSAQNQYWALLELANEIEQLRVSKQPADIEWVEKVSKEIMQLLHDSWAHPSNTKMEHIVRYYKQKGSPPGFLAELKYFKCKVCTICKGARVYKHTKRVKEKMAQNKKARMNKNLQQVLLETNLTEVGEEDDLLNAFGDEELHLYYAHSIAMGYNKERYYL
eukprot:3157842-Rhodomonas_salina.1